MFPIPFNFPFRKKDGSVTTISDAISSGGGGEPYELPTASENTKGGIKIGNRLTMNGEVLSADAQIPTYTESDNGKVLTVNDSGELEWDTKGTGGGDYSMFWDFTKYGSVTINGVVFSTSGATFNEYTDFILLFGYLDSSPAGDNPFNDVTIYIDVDSTNIIAASTHRRFIMTSSQKGFIFRSNGYWSFYSDNSWSADSEISDPNYFSNCKLKIYVDSNNYWHIYKDNVLVYEPTVPSQLKTLLIGSSNDSFGVGVITGARLYKGNYTET